MRNPFSSRKRIAVAAAGAAILFGGVTALAYWTSSGSGSGSGTVSTDPGGSLSVPSFTIATTNLYPGGNQPFTATVHNSAAYSVNVSQVALDLTQGDGSSGISVVPNVALTGSCAGNVDFTVTGLSITTTRIPASSTSAAIISGTLHMNDTANNQNQCQAAPVSVFLTVS